MSHDQASLALVSRCYKSLCESGMHLQGRRVASRSVLGVMAHIGAV
ncbi:hypothetical protein [Pseudomonas phage vB_Pae_BR123a]|nr:hypothetical protein [Pseudomonas phage vB_Pae_CF121c]QBI78141.1 hypothetical protein [Pseudomonas phage vB_Pae_BR52a]QBI78201.1 hypothetical protein [Pseudomonas phage vB_Pae_BR123a]QBI78261.1 hypothetical protein [Pseudomonas phage vB_Pae_BR143a]QBI78381.1 hypothetical protein [Pseudomonas phage vB_Pae_BR178a]QBI78732.1 hypothetical protein [Pseudomonas phage vB_Pae_BR322a]QBI78858.1 hypothetical protein [Pseudomonas phage vB_Pae_BR141a]